MRITTNLTAVALTGVALAAGVASQPGAAAASATPTQGSAREVVDMQRMHDAIPAGTQQLHEEMMTGPASRGMQRMMSPATSR